jgi:hypothetical protein
MPDTRLALTVLPELFAICRLPKDAQRPEWALTGEFSSSTRTRDELSIVCRQASVPEEVQCTRDWRCLKVDGTLDFALTGILACLLQPLAEARVSIFAISTFDTDYLFVKEAYLEKAIDVLSTAGHQITR